MDVKFGIISCTSAKTMIILFYLLKTFSSFFEGQVRKSECSYSIYKGKIR